MDPLSLILFNIVVDMLVVLISRAKDSGKAGANWWGLHNYIINIVTHVMFKQVA
jgi:hypothetical protein